MIDTRYIETDALVCAMEDAEEFGKDRLRELSPAELKRLRAATTRLDGWIEEVENERIP